MWHCLVTFVRIYSKCSVGRELRTRPPLKLIHSCCSNYILRGFWLFNSGHLVDRFDCRPSGRFDCRLQRLKRWKKNDDLNLCPYKFCHTLLICSILKAIKIFFSFQLEGPSLSTPISKNDNTRSSQQG